MVISHGGVSSELAYLNFCHHVVDTCLEIVIDVDTKKRYYRFKNNEDRVDKYFLRSEKFINNSKSPEFIGLKFQDRTGLNQETAAE